jgi:threonine dehydrogenase-like Zn-dependent dehydrogenase
MKAIRFDASIPRYLVGLTLGRLVPSVLWQGISCTYAADVAEPALPAADWVRIRTRYGGICGSDLNAIHLHTSLYYEPFSSFPLTLGHENCGTIAAVGPDVSGWRAGERVVAEPLLWCRPRGFTEMCDYCARGEINRCQRMTEGRLAPGLLIGGCRDTGGSWSASFVAHESQLYRLPDSVSDENALMLEPFACGLHVALQNRPPDDATVLIVGAGTIGLCTLAALRALGVEARIIVVARYAFQAETARRLGASEVLQEDDYRQALAARTAARRLQPRLGKEIYVGGADWTFECAGNDGALDDALRLTRGGGVVVLVGAPGVTRGFDLSPIFLDELDVRGAFTYHRAEIWKGEQRSTFALGLDMMREGTVDLGWMITHRFPLDAYGQALRLQQRRNETAQIKAVFDFGEG